MTGNIPNTLMIIIIFLLSLTSFQTNGLHVVNDENFQRWTMNIDQTMLDGILHSKLTESPPTIGRYTRPWIKSEREHYINAYKLQYQFHQ